VALPQGLGIDGTSEEEPGARPAFLDRACAGDEALRREIDSLLAAHDEAGEFLSLPAVAAGAASAEVRRFGPYRVLDEIGRGGMAVVYRAVRDDDLFHKTVALKLLSAVGSEVLLRRFFQERQILGRLQHPNIAAVFDGGATEEGQPYLVMELIDGRPITEYCDESLSQPGGGSRCSAPSAKRSTTRTRTSSSIAT
jgi:serine/threonine protein kinase